ncbi:hypothetical protein TanjilG_03214, partial [Lupinus angustifolius]
CMHYRRRCKIRAPCCDEVFDCRHCHNEAKNSVEINHLNCHDIPRHELKTVQQYCTRCGVCMSKYYCGTCKFFDDGVGSILFQRNNTTVTNVAYAEPEAGITSFIVSDVKIEEGHPCVESAITIAPFALEVICSLSDIEQDFNNTAPAVEYAWASIIVISKEQYHCDECGICRTRGSDNFFYCKRCGRCYSKKIEEGHPCVESAMHHNCPICFEVKQTTKCVREMEQNHRYSCPVCSKSMRDMTNLWKKLDNVDVEFTCEYKYDGERAQIHYMENGLVEVYSRNAEWNTRKLPDVVVAV